MDSPSLALQAALASALSATGLTVRESRVRNAAGPYVRIGDDTVDDQANACGDLTDILNRIHCFGRTPFASDAKKVAQAVREALRPDVSVAGYRVVMQDYEGELIQALSPDEGFKVIVNFRAVLEPLPSP